MVRVRPSRHPRPAETLCNGDQWQGSDRAGTLDRPIRSASETSGREAAEQAPSTGRGALQRTPAQDVRHQRTIPGPTDRCLVADPVFAVVPARRCSSILSAANKSSPPPPPLPPSPPPPPRMIIVLRTFEEGDVYEVVGHRLEDEED